MNLFFVIHQSKAIKLSGNPSGKEKSGNEKKDK